MRQIPSKALISMLVLSFIYAETFTALAKTGTSDPTIEAKKVQSAPKAPAGPPKAPAGPPQIPGTKALADLQAAQQRNNEMAIMHFTQMIQTNAKDSAAYAGRGKAYSGLRDYDKASADFDKAVEIDPKQVEAYKGRAVVKYLKKDIKGSWEDVHQVEALGGAMWPSFLEALKASSSQKS